MVPSNNGPPSAQYLEPYKLPPFGSFSGTFSKISSIGSILQLTSLLLPMYTNTNVYIEPILRNHIDSPDHVQ